MNFSFLEGRLWITFSCGLRIWEHFLVWTQLLVDPTTNMNWKFRTVKLVQCATFKSFYHNICSCVNQFTINYFLISVECFMFSFFQYKNFHPQKKTMVSGGCANRIKKNEIFSLNEKVFPPKNVLWMGKMENIHRQNLFRMTVWGEFRI